MKEQTRVDITGYLPKPIISFLLLFLSEALILSWSPSFPYTAHKFQGAWPQEVDPNYFSQSVYWIVWIW